MGEDIRIVKHIRLLPYWLLWHIWKGQNEMIFNKKAFTHDDIFKKAKHDTTEWLDETVIESLALQPGYHQITGKQSKWTTPRNG